MKRLFTLVVCAAILASCNTNKLEKAAKEQAKATLTEMAKVKESVVFGEMRNVYQKDSLCILHFPFTCKNLLGNEIDSEIEYIYYVSGGNIYEAYLDNDSIFLNEEQMNAEKKGTIYEKSTYDGAMLYKVVRTLNKEGRNLTKKGEAVELPIPTGTGEWEKRAYVDNFGEPTEDKYIFLSGKGKFSNSVATGSEMSVFLYIDNESVTMKFVEYDSYVVKEDEYFLFTVKDEDGDNYVWRVYNYSSGNMRFSGEALTDFLKIADKEGKVRIMAENLGRYSSSRYVFTLDLKGYKNAMAAL